MRCLLLTGWLVLIAGAGRAQEMDVRTFFLRALPADEAPRPQSLAPLRSPLIEAYDFRTETDRFDPARQEYTARLQFSTPGLARARRALYRTLLQAPDTERTEARCDQLEDGYAAWVELYLLARRRTLTDSLSGILDDRDRLLGLDLGRLRLPLDELLDLRTSRTELTLRAAELRGQEELIRQSFGVPEGSFTFGGFPDPADIAAVVERAGGTPYDDPERAYELAVLEREIALEQAEEQGVLDFLQVRYRGNPNDELGQRLHLGVAFRLQNTGSRRLKLRSLELERQRLEEDGRLEDQLQDVRRAVSRSQLVESLERYTLVGDVYRAEAADLATLARAAQGTTAADPGFLLDVERRRLLNNFRLLDAEADVYEAYLQWLEERGELCTGVPGQWVDSGVR